MNKIKWKSIGVVFVIIVIGAVRNEFSGKF